MKGIKKVMSMVLICALVFSVVGVHISVVEAKAGQCNEQQGDNEKITSVDKVGSVSWKEGSLATATWSEVENANYYYINVDVSYEGKALGSEITGTADTELDVQQEIHNIVGDMEVDVVQVQFSVISVYRDADGTEKCSVESDISTEWDYYFSVVYQLDTPQNVTLSDNGIARWDKVNNADSYYANVKIIYGDETYTDNIGTISYNESTCSASVWNRIRNVYKRYSLDGKAVKVALQIRAIGVAIDGVCYKSSYYSEWTGFIDFSDDEIPKLDAPTNVAISDDCILSWELLNDTVYRYEAMIKYVYGTKEYTYAAGSLGYDTTKNSVDLTNEIIYGYKLKGLESKEVQISVKVKAVGYTSGENERKASDYSQWSEPITYVNNDIVKLAAPSNVKLSADYIATWDLVESASCYYGQIYMYYDGQMIGSAGTGRIELENNVTEGTLNIEERIKSAYESQKIKRTDIEIDEVYVCFSVKAYIDETKNILYKSSNYSDNSNKVVYNPVVDVESITLSTQAPMLALNNDYYIGKTIYP
ncbi:MAG: hypothetical protein IJ272_07440 [Clostridia bacterium]|nr:hypothetical protein [Clostridia bacterium]